MKRLLFSFTAASAIALAESWTGTLVDVMCKDKDLANHTRECALKCADGGYALVLADGKLLKFDAAGNRLAMVALRTSTSEKDLKATVTGSLEGEQVKAHSIELQ